MAAEQRESPCAGCPFSPHTEDGKLGGSPVEVYVGQVLGPFHLPCHRSAGYRGNATKVGQCGQCVGAAMLRGAFFRVGYNMPEGLLRLKPDRSKAFVSLVEFVAHHKKVTYKEAVEWLEDNKPKDLLIKETNKPGVMKGKGA